MHYDDDEVVVSRLDVNLWRRILAHAQPYRRSMAGLCTAGMIVALCDVLQPWITGAVIDNAIEGGGGLTGYALAYAVIVVLLAAMVYLFIVFAGTMVTGIAYDLRQQAFERLQQMPFSFYDRRPVGWLMARLTSDCQRISGVLPWTMLDAVWGAFLLTGITGMMLWLNWKLALVVLSIVPPLAVATVVYQKKLIRTQRLARKVNSRITASYNEGIVGVRTTRTFVREEENLADFRVLTGEMFSHSVWSAIYSAVYLPVVMALGSVGIGLALWQGGVLAAVGVGLGELVTFMQYAGLFHIPIQEVAERFTGLQSAQASAERLQTLLDAQPEIQDAPEVLRRIEGGRNLSKTGIAVDGLPDKIGEVVFDRVDFSYQNGTPVLVDFDLHIRAGESIALVGETGTGKSTVARLLCRFYEPTAGRVLIDGIDYRQRSLQWLQSSLGVVLQEPHLFSGTIRENIRYGRLSATDAEVEAVARQVGAADFIQELAEGYETQVGEGGGQLSTGQKQFLSLARAMLADPQILVLDEATSSVDTETERRIQAGIETLIRGRISVMIAHRLSTIRAADRILVMDRGRIVEEGKHAELLRHSGHYARLYSRQFRREAASAAVRAGAEIGL